MQVNCPNCGEKATAENINIQKMTAVCAACDTVFPFELPETKAKRRKVKQPVKLNLRDDETLQMEFWTNFRLDRNEAFISSAFGSVGMTFVGLVLMGSSGVPPILPLVFLVVAAALFYGLALIVVNKTHIEMDEDTIRVTREPLPNPLNQGHEVSLAEVTAIKYEETAVSQKEGYDTPRYRVWAETADGRHRTIVNDVIEEYAIFITQRMEERLHMDDDLDVSHLEDEGQLLDDDADMRVRTSQNNGRR
jgi:uncharacterized DUF497 family protein